MSSSIYKGQCYCGNLSYTLGLSKPDELRTSICHCHNCKKFFGGPFGLTCKIPKSIFRYTKGTPKIHRGDNGSGTVLQREFCADCGSGILEFGEHAGDNIYVMYGTLEDEGRKLIPPKGEFFCSVKESWMPELPGVFHKQEIKE